MWIIILIIIAVLFFCFAYNPSADDTNQKPPVNSKSCSVDSTVVNKNYAEAAIKFFDGYLFLCKNHQVIAVCSLLYIDTDQFGINTKMECVITSIDGEHGNEAFAEIKRVWTQLRHEKMSSGDYSAVAHAGDRYIKEYFGCEDLHYVFTEADEYQFNDIQVIMSFEQQMFTQNGTKWQPTLSFIKQELQKKWKNAKITVGSGGIIVEA